MGILSLTFLSPFQPLFILIFTWTFFFALLSTTFLSSSSVIFWQLLSPGRTKENTRRRWQNKRVGCWHDLHLRFSTTNSNNFGNVCEKKTSNISVWSVIVLKSLSAIWDNLYSGTEKQGWVDQYFFQIFRTKNGRWSRQRTSIQVDLTILPGLSSSSSWKCKQLGLDEGAQGWSWWAGAILWLLPKNWLLERQQDTA